MSEAGPRETRPRSDERADDGDHFAFGENWREFLSCVDEDRIKIAVNAIQALLGRERLDGLRFLDIGSGSGLSSLAARRLGARVHSFDRDADSVGCTQALRSRYCAGDSQWSVERGSILDPDYLAKLGRFDVVYSWGVLHHTGAMYQAIAHACDLVGENGLFAFALYRKTRLCWLWTQEKRWYSNASERAQRAARACYSNALRLGLFVQGRSLGSYVSQYRSNRGMSYTHDLHDWLGGYPYESIRPEDVAREMKRLRFEHVRGTTRPYSWGVFGSGCDEYVYRRADGA